MARCDQTSARRGGSYAQLVQRRSELRSRSEVDLTRQARRGRSRFGDDSALPSANASRGPGEGVQACMGTEFVTVLQIGFAQPLKLRQFYKVDAQSAGHGHSLGQSPTLHSLACAAFAGHGHALGLSPIRGYAQKL